MLKIKSLLADNADKTNLLLAAFLCFFILEGLHFSFFTVSFHATSIYLVFTGIFLLCLPRLKVFLRDWMVYLALLNLFNVFRGVAYQVITQYKLPIYSQYIIDFEKLFTGHQSLSHAIQSQLYSPAHVSFLDRFLSVFYALHFVYFFMVGIFIWLKYRHDFWRYTYAYVLCSWAAILFYFIAPTVPPWMASEQGLITPVTNIFMDVILSNIPGAVKALDTNPVAAMPSLHMTYPFLAFLICYYHNKKYAIAPFIFFLIMTFAVIYLGAHYIGDLLAGLVIAVLSYYLFYHTMSPKHYSENVTATELGIAFSKTLIILAITACAVMSVT